MTYDAVLIALKSGYGIYNNDVWVKIGGKCHKLVDQQMQIVMSLNQNTSSFFYHDDRITIEMMWMKWLVIFKWDYAIMLGKESGYYGVNQSNFNYVISMYYSSK